MYQNLPLEWLEWSMFNSNLLWLGWPSWHIISSF